MRFQAVAKLYEVPMSGSLWTGGGHAKTRAVYLFDIPYGLTTPRITCTYMVPGILSEGSLRDVVG